MLIIIWSGRLAENFVCISVSQRSLWVSFSRTDFRLCIYHLFVWSNFNFFHNSQWITLPTQSCLVLYSFYANLLHSLILWLIVSSLLSHNLHLLFCCVLSIVTLIWLVLMALFSAAIRRDSVSLFSFPFLSYVNVFSFEKSLIIYSFTVFHISVSWWFFTGVWVTASLLKSPGLVSGFWPFSIMLSFG